MNNEEALAVTVLIVTRNRRNEVLVAIESALAQDWPSVEVLVYDDASNDGSQAAIKEAFPDVFLHCEATKSSANALRNQGFISATGDIVISLDDDCYFTDPATIRCVVNSFKGRPSLAVLGLPYIEPYRNSAHPSLDIWPGQPIASYTGCAAALRTSVCQEMGGYREWFGYSREEPDLSIRIRNRGYELEMADCPLLVHTKSTSRDSQLQDRYGIRNQIYFFWMNLPADQAMWRSLFYFVGMLQYRFRWSDIPRRLSAYFEGCVGVLRHLNERRPVSRACWRQYRSLQSHGRQVFRGGSVPRACARRLANPGWLS